MYFGGRCFNVYSYCNNHFITGDRHIDNRRFGTVDIMEIDILGVDIMAVDVSGIDILALPRILDVFPLCFV